MALIIHHRAIGAFHAFLTPTWPIAPLPTPATAATDQHSGGAEDEEEGEEQPHVHDDIQSLYLSTIDILLSQRIFWSLPFTRQRQGLSGSKVSDWLSSLNGNYSILVDLTCVDVFSCFLRDWGQLTDVSVRNYGLFILYRSHSHMLMIFPVF